MGGGGGREAANEVCQGKHKAGRKGGEAGSGKQAITAVTISVVIMMSQSAVRRVPRCNCIGSVRLGCLIRGIAACVRCKEHARTGSDS